MCVLNSSKGFSVYERYVHVRYTPVDLNNPLSKFNAYAYLKKYKNSLTAAAKWKYTIHN